MHLTVKIPLINTLKKIKMFFEIEHKITTNIMKFWLLIYEIVHRMTVFLDCSDKIEEFILINQRVTI